MQFPKWGEILPKMRAECKGMTLKDWAEGVWFALLFTPIIPAVVTISIIAALIHWDVLPKQKLYVPSPPTAIEQVQTLFMNQTVQPCSVLQFESGKMLVFSVREKSATLISEYSNTTQIFFEKIDRDGWSHNGLPYKIGDFVRVIRPGEDGNINTNCFR